MFADTLCARALECNGLSYGNLTTRLPYLKHCYGGDVTPQGNPNADAQSMGSGQYACQLHQRGVLAEDEVDGMIVYRGKEVDILRCAYAPYIGQIDAMLQALGKARGLLVTGGDALGDIQPADLVTIGMGGKAPDDPAEKARWLAEWGGVAHGVFVTGVRGTTILCTDGGQQDPANVPHGTAIANCERYLVKRTNGWWLADAHGAKRINWRIRGGALPLRSK